MPGLFRIKPKICISRNTGIRSEMQKLLIAKIHSEIIRFCKKKKKMRQTANVK
jgi:hypothetical protein